MGRERWQELVQAHVVALGYDSIAAFVAARPGTPYPALATELGEEILGVMVAEAQLREARDAGRLRDAAADGLVRCLRQVLTGGWSRTEPGDPEVTIDFMNITGWSLWIGLFMNARFAESALDAMWAELLQRAPAGWLPRDADDEVIRAVIDALYAAGPPT
jgi:hypothetical protein